MGKSYEGLIQHERWLQDEKWGEQNHTPGEWLAILVEEVGELAKALLEKSPDPSYGEHVEQELIQVAAVAKAMWESGKRNQWL